MSKYKLHLLQIRDFKRIQFAEIDFAAGLTILGGKNAMGKTSAIDALVSILGGAKHAPQVPVRVGAEKAELNLVIEGPAGKLFARRYFTDGGTALEVKTAEGFKSDSPQRLFDSFLGALALDPLAFTRVDGAKQVAIFKKAFGIDTSEIEAKRKKAYDERTIQNRLVRDLDGRFRDMPKPPETTPDEEVSVASLNGELQAALNTNGRADAASNEAERLASRLNSMDETLANEEVQVAEIEKRLTEAKAELDRKKVKRGEVEKEALASQKVASGLERVDTVSIMSAIESAEETNRLVRAKKERDAARVAWKEAEQKAFDLSEEIEAADKAKASAIQAVKLPVEGLSFDEGGLYLNGIPFSQASSAEQLRVSVPLAFASESEMKFAIIRDGSLLDDESLALVAQLVDEAGGQLIVERVGESDAGAIIFENGAVKGAQPELVEA